MKKKFIIPVLVCIVGVIATACTKTETSNFIMATGGTSGTYYPYGGAMSQIIAEHVDDVNITAQSTGASVENCKLLNSAEAELGIIQNDMIDYAYNGIEVFAEDGKLENLRAIAALYPEVIQLVVSEESGISSLEDLRGKKISVGAPGSGVEANVRQIFDVAGLTYDDLSVSFLSFAESADSIKDKHIDGAFVVAGIPNAAIQDVASQNKIKIIPIAGEISSKLSEKYPFYSSFVIPAGTYNNQDADVTTVAVQAALVVNSEMAEDMVYNITKALFENQADLAVAHAKGAELSLENALDGISIPVHPGAERFFKEAGVL